MKLAFCLLLPLFFADVAPRKTENILVMGDSEAGSVYFALSGAKKKDESLGQTAARLAGATHNGESLAFEYKGGTPIDYWSKQGHGKEAIDKHPEAGTVIIFLGTNDYWKRETPDVEPLLKEVRAAGLKCIWAGNTSVNGRKWSLNTKLKAVVEKDSKYTETTNT
jgi:hypothetical protein